MTVSHDQRAGVVPISKTKDVPRMKRAEVSRSPEEAFRGHDGFVGVECGRPELLDVLGNPAMEKCESMKRLSNFNEHTPIFRTHASLQNDNADLILLNAEPPPPRSDFRTADFLSRPVSISCASELMSLE